MGILDKAGEFLDELNYDLAQKFCQRALRWMGTILEH